MAKIQVEITFPCTYQFQILERLPMLIEEPRQFVFPEDVEEAERGALIVRICPENSQAWVGIFAKGFDAGLTGVFSTPNPEWLCAVSGGYAYLVNAQPEQWHFVKSRPVVHIEASTQYGVLLLTDFQTVSGFTSSALLWQTAPLSWEGVKITSIGPAEVQGWGWDAIQDKEVPFSIDIQSGKHTGGGMQPKATR